LKHYKGRQWAGKFIQLSDCQQFCLGSLFGWISVTTGLRRFRTSYNEWPRKNGKSLMAAVVESLRDAMLIVHGAGVDPREFAGIVTQSLFPTPVYQYLGGLLASRQVQGGPRVPNPFLPGVHQCAETAEQLGLDAPLVNHIHTQSAVRPAIPNPTGQATPVPSRPQ